MRVIARRPDTIVGFGDTRIHAETATFELRASESPTRARAISSCRRRDLRHPGRAGAARSRPARVDARHQVCVRSWSGVKATGPSLT